MERNIYSPELILGENVLSTFDNVMYENTSRPGSTIGCFIITDFRILFVSQLSIVNHTMKGQVPDYNDACNCTLPHCTIDKFKLKKNELICECKDFRVVKFAFTTDSDQAFRGIENFANVKQTGRFCYTNQEIAQPIAQKEFERFEYSTEQEFERFKQRCHDCSANWRISTVNADYSVCSTYPKHFIVPAGCGDDDLKKVAEHRSRGRLPILSYVHDNGATIVRCAQPKAGLRQGKSKADVNFATALVNANKFSKGLSIMDARPKLNAAANRGVGGGYENTSHYESATLKFLDIENIHVMRDAVNSLKDICLSTGGGGNFLTEVDNTMCLTHVRIILDGAWQIAQKVLNGETVLVHCSDGWDRTAQLCALSALFLDPYHRTLKGFLILIEKEWIQAGHKFNDRIGQDNSASRSERSPVFLQFMDCVWQVTQQFPTAFEFNENLLLDMLDALYSCRFGTFLFNCEKEREDNGLRAKSPSFWDYALYNKLSYHNPCYDPPPMAGSKLVAGTPSILQISVAMKDLKIWYSYYMQHVYPERSPMTVMLQDEIRRLRGILSDMGHGEELSSANEVLLNSTAIPSPSSSSSSFSSSSPSPPPSWSSVKVRPSTRNEGEAMGGGSRLLSSNNFRTPRTGAAEGGAAGGAGVGGEELLKVLYKWDARDENEVSVEAEEVVKLVRKSSDNWWFVERMKGGKESGHVPSTYVTAL